MAVPILAYGFEIWTTKTEKKLENAEISFLRIVAGYTIRNTKTREELNIYI
jgi:hypothetical protein